MPAFITASRILALCGLSAALAIAAAPAQSARRLAGGERIPGPGEYEIRLQQDGRERFALLHVPANYDARQPMPLVVALHGGGGSAQHMADDRHYGLIGKSESAGFLVLFPNGVSNRANGMLATWNAGNCCGRARDGKVDDVGFLRALVADVSRRANVAPQRVYATGMSNGAMMAYRLACEASDVFHAIMAVAGTDNTAACAPANPVPVLHVHARDDELVLFGGGAGRSRRTDQVTDFVSVADSIAKWVRLDHAAATPKRVLSVTGAYCDLHEALPGGAPVQLCVTETGGHSWPGGNKARAGEAPSRAVSANDLMWEFFTSR
ncbi:MAG: PHB depolymerase family esterase [Steroidobacteraceae bacterium]